MRSKKRTIGILIVVIVLLLGFASSLLVYRNKLSSEKTKNNSNNNTAQSLSSAPSGISIENFYDKPITDEKIALDSIEANRDKLGYSDKNFTFIYDEISGSETSYHFDLYYKDIPVYEKGVGVFTHYSDNSAKVLMSSVSDAEKIIKVNTMPQITENESLNIAKEALGEKFSEYNIGADFKQVKVNPKLTIYKYNDEYNLVYYIQSGFYMCVINAENGDIIEYHSTEMANSAEYEGQKGDIHTVFYEDYKDENYDIKNALWNRDKSLFIFDNCIDSISLNYILKLDDIKDGNNKSAVDGMANTYRAIEYFEQENFDVSFNNTWVIVNNNKSKDENGKTRKDNATGQVCFIGDKPVAIITFDIRSSKSKAQLSAYLDVVAHEYTHAVTGLKAFGSIGYSKDSRDFERNALGESYSDIFGQLIEQKYTGETDWIQSVPNNRNRNLKKPKINKYSKLNKNADYDKFAHDNSTIISHTAYLMSKDNCNSKYNNDLLLDYDQLGQLWYGSLEYLKKTEFKDFSDCRYAVEFSAKDLIEKGVLSIDSLKVIQSAFDEVEVETDIHPMIEVNKIPTTQSENNTLVVPIEDETNPSETVEITEIPTEPETTTVDISYEGEYGNLRYLVKDGEVIITGCFMQDMTNVEIPSEIDGFPVTTIGNGAFYGENLVSISFPNSITKIKAGAFDYTPWLSKKREENPIVIENNILISWDKTKNETDVIIPDGVISIAGRVFKDYDMVSVTIPNSVVYIGDEAFSECYYLSNVIMSDNITEIGDKAFNGCTKLTSITIPNGTKSIGDYAFAGCEKLVDVTIADSIMSAGCYVFGGQFGETTPWLEEKRKENPIVVVGSVVIDGITCNGDVIIPDNVTEIAEEAFWGSELNSITFPDSIVKIGDSAFGNCKNLSSVVIPKNTEEIGESFSFCESLKEIIFLNPKCKIPISRFTIYNQTESEGNYYTEWYYNGVIKGYKNSTAQEYAELYGYEFIEIEN